MIARTLYRLVSLGLLILILGSAFAAVAASNTIPESGADESSRPITANDLKPPGCSATLTSIVAGSGFIFSGGANSLILGSPNNDFIFGGSGADCILGGDGNDTLWGGAGVDVCYGQGGNDSFTGCETQVP